MFHLYSQYIHNLTVSLRTALTCLLLFTIWRAPASQSEMSISRGHGTVQWCMYSIGHTNSQLKAVIQVIAKSAQKNEGWSLIKFR